MSRTSLSLNLPINKIDDPFRDIFSDRSMAEMVKLNEHVELAVLICAQGAFDAAAQERAKAICAAHGIDCRVTEVPEENPCRIAYLRETANLLKPESDYYMLLDDDNEFVPGSAEKYLAAIAFFEANPKCGSLGNYGEFGSVAYGHEIRPDPHGKIAATQRGLMFRNIFEGRIFPEETLMMFGPYEEMAAIIKVNLAGYWYAKQFKVPTKIKRKIKKIADGSHPDDNQLHSIELGNANVRAWIRRVMNKPYYLYGDSILNLGFGIKPKGKA